MEKYCETNCPICKSNLTENILYMNYLYCLNNCYFIQTRSSEVEIKIFKKTFIIPRKNYKGLIKEYKEEQENKLQKEIRYWKKNDRYLTKILEGDN